MAKAQTTLTAERLRELLDYDPKTGVFRWKGPRRKVKPGQVAGYKNPKNKYIYIRVDFVRHFAHRLAWLYVYGEHPESQIDHINGIRDDNRIANLRPATPQTNQYNKRMAKNNTSGVKGVNWAKREGKWRARFNCEGRAVYVGLFDTLDDAAAAIKEARESHHGQFFRHA